MRHDDAPRAPFFVAGGPVAETRRMLLLSYLFPPSPAVGALRWQKFAGHLAAAGIGLDAITLDPARLATRDQTRLEDLPAGTRVFGVDQPQLVSERVEQALLGVKRRLHRPPPSKAPETGRIAAASPPARADSWSRADIFRGAVPGRDWMRAWHARQDLGRIDAWARRAAAVGRSLLREYRYRAIISCGPPHPAHEAARTLAREGGLPLVIDLRDPWALVERIPAHIASPAWYRLSARAERRVVEAASLVVLNTEAARDAMRAAHPDAAGRMVCVMNGCDEELVAAPPRRGRFLVAYAGSIYLDRDPRPLFEAARRVTAELGLGPERFGMEFMGNVERYQGRTITTIAEAAGVGAYVRVHPPRPRSEALAFLAGASVLLSLPQDSEMAIPSKIFEYFQYDAWILALAEPESATGRLLTGTTADTVPARDVDGIARVLRQRYQEWQRGELPRALAREPRFTRRHQAERLIAALDQILGTPRPVEASWAG